ncbi:Rieske (2Fe-2S) protein [Actinosynnema sp. CS-041913]|uniref:Rieske (2Fe-2S) protein n=1 Tax=Actinosynnema sp. CS-041913 TaxID=3239917 RepID=UPI003D90EAD3
MNVHSGLDWLVGRRAQQQAPEVGETEWHAGRVADFADGVRKILRAGDLEIGVFRVGDRWYAYRNLCLHQGGPVCEGELMPKVEAVLADDRTLVGERFSDTEQHLVCPWHGWEYELETGRCVTVPSRKLTAFAVVVRGDDVYVRT